jgi:hypothetical protein
VQGRWSEARDQAAIGQRLFPEDKGFSIYLAMIAAGVGDHGTAKRVLSDALQAANERQARMYRTAFAFVEALRRFDFLDRHTDDSQFALSHLAPMWQDMLKLQREIEESSGGQNP